MGSGWEYTERAATALAEAERAAGLFHHEYLGTEHILLGLVQVGGAAFNVLGGLGIAPDQVRQAVGGSVRQRSDGELALIGRRRLTPRAEKALEYSAEEAGALDRDHGHVGTEHLLLGLLCESEGVAFEVLTRLGVGLDGARAEVYRRRPAPEGWQTTDVTALVRGIVADGADDRLPILADALQEAGCDDAEVLEHLRREPHGCRAGCWVLDRLLGADQHPVRPPSAPVPSQERRWWQFWK